MEEVEIEIEIPHYFVCPISLQMMKDPVTVPSGITYDRQSIETWLFSAKNPFCPVTKHPISAADSDSLTPNHTLRRLIQAWCTLHSAHGIERFPTPKPPLSKPQIQKLISPAATATPSSLLSSIRRLRSLAADSESNRRCIESAGAPLFLASVISNSLSDSLNSVCCHEAISTLHNLRLSDSTLRTLAGTAEFFETLTRVMEQGTYESRAYAALVLKSTVEAADPMEITFLKREFFVEIVGILKDQTESQQSVKAALGVLVAACPWGRNRVKAVEAGGVAALVEILLSAPEKRVCEMALTAVDLLCGCAEGRAALLGHGGGMAVVSKKILRVSQVGSERAVRILLSVAKYSATPAVLTEMAELGIVAKLCLVVQVVEGGSKTKEKVKEILKMHARVWRNSRCIPLKLVSSYPKPN